MAYDLYPAVDENYNFPPEIRAALAKAIELRNQVISMTEAERNNLTSEELWNGRVIINSTTQRLNRYDAQIQDWVIISEESDAILSFNEIARDNLTGPDLWDGRLILNTTTNRINRYDEASSSWTFVVEPLDLKLLLTDTVVPLVASRSPSLGVSEEAARADHVHPMTSTTSVMEVFTSSGVWTMPENTTMIDVILVGAGGGGGAGGSNPGSHGGGGGAAFHTRIPASEITSTVSVTVGSGGSGGRVSGDIEVQKGKAGGTTSFGSYLIMPGAPGGLASGTTPTPGGKFGGAPYVGGTGGLYYTQASNSTIISAGSPPNGLGAGGGGSYTQPGGNPGLYGGAGGAGAVDSSSSGKVGSPGVAPGGGGGGGCFQFTSGDGGAGARGEIIVVAHLGEVI